MSAGPLVLRAFAEIAFVRQVERGAVRREQHADARTIRVGRVHLSHDRDLAGAQPHEVAGRIDAEQLHEAAHEVLIELRAVVALQHGQDAVGRKRLLVGALRAHRVVDVGDAAQHRAEVERRRA